MNAMLNRQERAGLRVNMWLSAAIFVLGVSSLAVSALSKPQQNFFFEFRYMTMNGTVFTTLIALIIVSVYAVQLQTGRLIVVKQLYYFRLSAAVTESIIAIVILLSFFPFVPDNPSILSFDSFNMHVMLPLLTVVSFLMSESPAKTMHPLMRLNCAWFITLYAVVVITLIMTGLIPQEKIPYSFLDFRTRSLWYIVPFGMFIYSFSYVLSVFLTEGNKRVYDFRRNKGRRPVRSA